MTSSVFLYLLLTLVIGFLASNKIKTTQDFTLAGRNLPMIMVAVTIFATWFGPELIMGVPGQFVKHGFMGIITDQFGNLLCLLLIGLFCAKKLYEKDITTISDFFRIRYNKKLELITSLIYVFTYFFWIAAQFVALAYLFESLLDLSITNGIFLGASIVVLYTLVGGMWAVSWSDLLQSILIVIGLGFLLVNVLTETNGITPLFVNQPESFFNVLPDKGFYNWTDYLAMWMAFGIGAIPAQEIYQRIFSAKSSSSGKTGVLLSSLLLFGISIIPLLIGLGAAFLHPELMETGEGQNLIPDMVSKYAGLPLQILLYGAIISAILSTSSGAMLSPATIIGENILKPIIPQISDTLLLRYTRVSVVVVGLISCWVAMNDSNIHGLVIASAVLMMVCIFAPLMFGLYWKKSSVFGAWAAIICGATVWGVCNLIETRVDATIYGTLASCTAMVLGSFLVPNKKMDGIKMGPLNEIV